MTAPDPGLTDLIAAHRLKQSYWNWWGCTGCDWRTKGAYGGEPTIETATEHAKHVVEQHTNGRITELEARVAEAQSLCRDTGRYNAARTKHWNIRVFACDVLAALKGRAALEGEQQ